MQRSEYSGRCDPKNRAMIGIPARGRGPIKIAAGGPDKACTWITPVGAVKPVESNERRICKRDLKNGAVMCIPLKESPTAILGCPVEITIVAFDQISCGIPTIRTVETI